MVDLVFPDRCLPEIHFMAKFPRKLHADPEIDDANFKDALQYRFSVYMLVKKGGASVREYPYSAPLVVLNLFF